MPAYNSSKTIEASIRSVLAQTFTDFELLIIDDRSADDTFDIAEKLTAAEPRAQILRNSKNSGVSFSRNYGVSEASGEWVAFIDSDDLWIVDKLKKQLELIHETGAVISYTSSAFINSEGKPFDYILPAVPELTYRELLKRNLLSCSSVVVRRDLMLRYRFGGDRMSEDYANWLKIVKEVGCAYGLDEPLLIYRLSEGSKSSRRVNAAMMTYRTYRYVGYNAIVAAALTLRYAVWSVRKRKLIKHKQGSKE
jgi:teichuronic acid biosynthesis glycosyltransferase TuaG